MKRTSLFKGVEKATIKLPENQLFSVRGKYIQIHCFYGDLWITWPKKSETVLKGGHTLRISSKGKVCIMALSNAFFQMSTRRWYADGKILQESGVTSQGSDIFPIPFETHGFFEPTEKNIASAQKN